MIKPPFTIIILKNQQHPVTIRVTMRLIVGTLGLFTLIGAFIGITASMMIFGGSVSMPLSGIDDSATVYTWTGESAEQSPDIPDVHNLTVSPEKDKTRITMSIQPLPEDEVLIWLIVNPSADMPSEMVVYPRNPIFRGLPVDYRNGVLYSAGEENGFSLTLSEEAEGIEIDEFRVIMYSSNGAILSDRHFQEKESPRT